MEHSKIVKKEDVVLVKWIFDFIQTKPADKSGSHDLFV